MLVEAGLNTCMAPNQMKIKQRHEKRRPENRHFFSAKGRKKRNVHDQEQEILGKVDRHVIAEEFPRKILEQQPAQKKVHAVAPVVENRQHDRSANDAQDGVGQASHIVVDHILGGFVGGERAHDEGAEERVAGPSGTGLKIEPMQFS